MTAEKPQGLRPPAKKINYPTADNVKAPEAPVVKAIPDSPELMCEVTHGGVLFNGTFYAPGEILNLPRAQAIEIQAAGNCKIAS